MATDEDGEGEEEEEIDEQVVEALYSILNAQQD